MDDEIPPDRVDNTSPERKDREEDSPDTEIVDTSTADKDTRRDESVEVPQNDDSGLNDKAESTSANISKALFTETAPTVSFSNSSLPATSGGNHRVVGESPTKPINGRTSSPTKRDYKALYEEVKRRLADYSKKTESKLDKLQQDYDLLQIKYEAEMESYKLDYSEREVIIATENKVLKDKIKELEEKAKIEMESVKTNYEHLVSEKEAIIKEKMAEIATLEEKTPGNDNICHGLHRIKSDDDLFRLKPKGRNAKSASDKLVCDFPNCSQKNVDLIQCNMCHKWVCEDCNDIQVAKLKPILNKCRTIHFLCKSCDEKIGSKVPDHEKLLEKPVNDSNLLLSLQNMLDKKVNQMESTIEKAIDKKLEDKMAAITTLNDKIKDNSEAVASTTAAPSYAKVLELPTEVRKIMQEARNDEKVEKIEQEKRSQNFIIHGAEEIGNNNDEIKENDKQYIKDILKHLTVKSQASSITRIGKPNDRKKRVLKIVMKSDGDKEKVMDNLRRLKGTEEEFGKISVTHDYTSTDREKIKEFTNRAKQKSEEDPSRVYKVRGDPKNGLRIISYEKT